MSAKRFLLVFICAVFVFGIESKVFERCELARALKNTYGLPQADIPNWVCIAFRESSYNTAAKSSTNDYGIFQINSKWWCSPPGTGCGVKCSALLDSDIADDVKCALIIKRQQGWDAWYGYKNHCKNENVNNYVSGCY